MKMLIVLLVVGFVGYIALDNIHNDNLVKVYCRRTAQDVLPRRFMAAVEVRDRDSEKEFVEKCLESLESESVLEVGRRILTKDSEFGEK